MRIGEVAKRTGLSASRIRFYEARGLLPKTRRAANGYRDYPESVLEALSFIERAQALGFSLREIVPSVASGAARKLNAEALIRSLQKKLAHVEAHLERSKALRETLLTLIEEQRACLPAPGLRASRTQPSGRDTRGSAAPAETKAPG